MDLGEIIELVNIYLQELPAFPGPVEVNDSVTGFIDQTLLKPEVTSEQISKLCHDADELSFAAVCVNPVHIAQVAQSLAGSDVKACTVVGFPLGATPTAIKVAETLMYIQLGAQEIDMVLPVGHLKAGRYDLVFEDIRQVAQAAHSGRALLKVIIETCLLDRREKIAASLLCKAAKADFVKTSTGFSSAGATVEDIELVRRVVGPVSEMGVKASGGIRTLTDVRAMIRAGANRVGTSSGVSILLEEKQEKS